MDGLFRGLWTLLVLIFGGLWSIRDYLLIVVFIVWLQWFLKDILRSTFKEALQQNVTPLLDDISQKMDDITRKMDDNSQEWDDLPDPD